MSVAVGQPTKWREKLKRSWAGLVYFAMSAFIALHTIVIVFAPAPEAIFVTQSLRAFFKPYLYLFMLDHEWNFFAPRIDKYSQLRYVIEDAEGKKHTFVPIEETNWFHPSHLWFTDWYWAIIQWPDEYGATFAALYCRKHDALNPASVTLLQVQQQEFWPADHLNGKHPLDPEFVTVKQLSQHACNPDAGRRQRGRGRLRPRDD